MRTGYGPQNTATLHSLTIPLLTESWMASLPEAVRWVPYETFTRPLELLQIP
ncbi:hypothetical protein [Nocardiopsis valliformis]|uniref:hypothetical protein n=1 Tax=Nocardiopsis valliformis TaxID=239974 RepID=UPI0003472612|nr:hypothetical protein [Nocardiopsis valliformis]